MKKQKTYLYKWHKNISYAFIIHYFGILLSIVFIIQFFKEHNLVWLIISILILISSIASFIYSFVFGWNAPVYLDNEKAWTKIKGMLYVWKWNDVTSCKVVIRNFGWRNPLSYRIEIETEENYKKLVLEYSVRRKKLLLQFDLKEEVKEKFLNASNDDE